MDLSISPGSIWKVGVRSLTNIGALTVASTGSTSIAASASVDLRPAVGQLGELTVGVITGGTATAATGIALFDGTNSINVALTAASANSAAAFTAINTNGFGIQLHNTDAAVAARYQTSQFLWAA